MAKIQLTPAEIRAFSEKVAVAFESLVDECDEDTRVALKDAVTIVCGLDQVGAEYDLMTAAQEALEDFSG
jgi:hypothetical protein